MIESGGQVDIFESISELDIPLIFKPLISALGFCLPAPLLRIMVTTLSAGRWMKAVRSVSSSNVMVPATVTSASLGRNRTRPTLKVGRQGDVTAGSGEALYGMDPLEKVFQRLRVPRPYLK